MRKTDFPKNFIVFREDNVYYLLYWVEVGKDGSVYVWFSDRESQIYQIKSKHEQISITKEIPIHNKALPIYNPHVSYHPSGRVHIRGYKDLGQKPKEYVIRDRQAEELSFLLSKKAAVPYCLISTPIHSINNWSLKNISSPKEFIDNNWNYVEITSKTIDVLSSGKPNSTVIVLDSSVIGDNPSPILNSTLFVHGKGDFDFNTDNLRSVKRVVGEITLNNELSPSGLSLQFSLIHSEVKEEKNKQTQHIVLYNKECVTTVSISPMNN